MSYIPTIIINRKQLEVNRRYFEENISSDDYEEKRIAEYVEKALTDQNKIKFGELELVIIEPELSMVNELLRDTLDELEIEYQIHF